jgi:hypothetical protein
MCLQLSGNVRGLTYARLCWARHTTLIKKTGDEHRILVRRVLGKQSFGVEANWKSTLKAVFREINYENVR